MKITLQYIKSLISEGLNYLYELDVINDGPTQDYSELSEKVHSLASKLSEEVKDIANREIKRAITTGRGHQTHHNALKNDQMSEFNYITTALASIYPTVDEIEKHNIKRFLMAAYSPFDNHGGPSPFAITVAKTAGIQQQMTFKHNIDVNYYLEFVNQAIYDSLDYSLDHFSPDKGTFGGLLSLKAANNVRDMLKSPKARTMFTGFGKEGEEDIYGGGEEGDSGETKLSRYVGNQSKDASDIDNIIPIKNTPSERSIQPAHNTSEKSLAAALSRFIKAKIKGNANFLEFFELFAEQGKSLEQIAQETGKDINSLYQIKNKLEKVLDTYVKDGSLSRYIERMTGEYIKFPKNSFKLHKVKDLEHEIHALAEIHKFVNKLVCEVINSQKSVLKEGKSFWS